MEDNKVYLTKSEFSRYILKGLNLGQENSLNKISFQNFVENKFAQNNDIYYENEFKDTKLLKRVINLFFNSSKIKYDINNYFLIVDLFNTINPITDIEKDIFIDLSCAIVWDAHINIIYNIIIDYYNTYSNKEYFYRSINDKTNKFKIISECNHPTYFEDAIRFLINIRSSFINEEDYFTYSSLVLSIMEDKHSKLEKEIINKLNIKRSRPLNNLNSVIDYEAHLEFIKNIYNLNNQKINKTQLLELKQKLDTLKKIRDNKSTNIEEVEVIEKFIDFLYNLLKLENTKEKEVIDYKAKYEEIKSSEVYNSEFHHNKFDLILKNVLMNKNILLIGPHNSGKSYCLNQLSGVLNKEVVKMDLEKLYNYDKNELNQLLSKDIILCIDYKYDKSKYGKARSSISTSLITGTNLFFIDRCDKIINDLLNMTKNKMFILNDEEIEVNPNMTICIISEEDIQLDNVVKIDIDVDYELRENLEKDKLNVYKRTKGIKG